MLLFGDLRHLLTELYLTWLWCSNCYNAATSKCGNVWKMWWIYSSQQNTQSYDTSTRTVRFLL